MAIKHSVNHLLSCLAIIPETGDNLPYPLVLNYIIAGFAVFVIYTWALALNALIWTRFRINYVFIFELNPRDHLSYYELFQVSFLSAVGQRLVKTDRVVR